MQAQSIPVGSVQAKQIRERRIDEHVKEIRRAVHDGEWSVARGEVDSLSSELAEIVRLDEIELVAWPVERINACELKPGQGVKAEGAPAWSKIRDVRHLPGRVEVKLDWGRIVYEADEDVEVAHLPESDCDQCHGDGWIITGGTPVHAADKAWCPSCYPEHWERDGGES